MFEAMVDSIAEDTVRGLYMLRLRTKEEPKRVAVAKPTIAGQGDGTIKRKPVNRASRKIGRNDPCPCGSGKKYKNCCMLKDQMQNG